jgi:hypothetical protein
MTTHKEALTLALEALKKSDGFLYNWHENYSDDEADAYAAARQLNEQAIIAAEKALAQPEQEPEFVTHNVDKPYDWSEWVCPNPSGYLMKCCDCGLVHEAEFGVVRYKSETDREDCDMVDDPNLQAVFRMRRSEKWSPEDTAHRAGGLPMAQPEQEQNLKLMPREATPEMLKAMDECSTEGYDERLYEGHAWSVYMAAWDAFYGQHCYCGDITSLGVIHRDDGPCHYPYHKEPEQEPVAWMSLNKERLEFSRKDTVYGSHTIPLYTTPPQRTWVGLTGEEMDEIWADQKRTGESITRAIETKLKEKNT